MRTRIHRWIVPVALLALGWSVPTPAHAQDDDLTTTLVDIEKSLWEAWQNGSWDVFRANLAEDAVNNGAGGVMAGLDEMLGMMEDAACDVESFTLSDFQLHEVARDVAILTYRAEQTGVCGDRTLPSPVWASSVYVNQNGVWKNVLYQETPAG